MPNDPSPHDDPEDQSQLPPALPPPPTKPSHFEGATDYPGWSSAPRTGDIMPAPGRQAEYAERDTSGSERPRGKVLFQQAYSEALEGIKQAPFTYGLSGTATLFLSFLFGSLGVFLVRPDFIAGIDTQRAISEDFAFLVGVFVGCLAWGFFFTLLNVYIASLLRTGNLSFRLSTWLPTLVASTATSLAFFAVLMIPYGGVFVTPLIATVGALWCAAACHTGTYLASLQASLGIVWRNPLAAALIMVASMFIFLAMSAACAFLAGFALAYNTWVLHAAYFQAERRPWSTRRTT